MIFEPVTQEDIEEGITALLSALAVRSLKHGPETFHDVHKGLGVLTEEFHEFIEACKSNKETDIMRESMDIAVPALWIWLSVMKERKLRNQKA